MSKKSEPPKDKVVEVLLGDDFDFDSASEVDRFLTAVGESPQEVVWGFTEHLKRKIAAAEDAGKEARLRKALEMMGVPRELDSMDEGVFEPISKFWTNESVLQLGRSESPIEVIIQKCRKLLYEYSEGGGEVSPLDPFALAKFVKSIRLVPLDIVPDARTRTVGGQHILEFNPNRPRARVRYSVCHEIVHTFFPDCGEKTRNRATHEEMLADDWQLEMLCNIGAGELLMPFDQMPTNIQERIPSVEDVLEIRRRFQVSTEAVFLRLARVSRQPFCVFSASRKEPRQTYYIDYTRPTRGWIRRLPHGTAVPSSSVVGNCSAIGFSDNGVEKWPRGFGDVRVDCVGISPYPGRQSPRVMGIISDLEPSLLPVSPIRYVRGDATEPRLGGYRTIAHIVNDKTANWGGPFARAVKRRWPEAQTAFQAWAKGSDTNLRLGSLHLATVSDDLAIATIVCQHGYGESARSRLRYGALQEGLRKLARFVAERSSSVHMPRIGSGEARGDWGIISGLIEENLSAIGIDVTVYALPNAEVKESPQAPLDFGR